MVQHSSTVVEHVLEETPVSLPVLRIVTEYGAALLILTVVEHVLEATPVSLHALRIVMEFGAELHL